MALRVAGAGAFVAALSLVPMPPLPAPALAARTVAAQEPAPVAPVAVLDDVAALLPADLWITVEGRGLGTVANGWLGGRLHPRIVRNAAWKQFQKSPQHAQLLAGLGFVELVSGMKPAALASALLGEQIAIGVLPDGERPAAAAVVRTADAEVTAHLVSVARGFAASSQGGAAARALDYRGVDATAVGEQLYFAALDRLLLIASTEPLFQGLVDRALAPAGERTLSPLFAAMRRRAPGEPLLRFAVDVKKLAATRPGGRLVPEKSDNFGGAMLLGDLLELAARADVLCGSLDARGDELAIAFDVPGAPALLPPHFRSFGHASAQLPLQALAPPGTLLTASLRRDWAKFWEDRVELCDPATEKEFAELRTGLGLFLGGKSLPDEVLPQIGDEILFVLARQDFPGVAQPPKVRYPAGAFVYRARGDAQKLGQDFAIGVHALVAIVNLDRAQKTLTPLLPYVEVFDGVTVYGGRCLADDGRPPDPVRFNVSPAAAWVGDRIIVSSSDELLRALVRELRKPITGAAGPQRSGLVPSGCTSYLRIDGAALHRLALEDREALVTNAVVNEGKPEAQAQAEIDLACELLGQLSHATLQTRVLQDGMRVELAVTLTPPAPTTPSAAPAASGGPR